ncbi:MAG: glycosyltransferase family 4 protein [Candidatus Marinimicrobia bacterium]|nr:glycosyltransferase family 4 protein [Candidatus Neomarinimicrobiota bacterium]
MNIIHIVPGTGSAFYCENCVKDGGLVKALQKAGHSVTMIPLYLPLTIDDLKLVDDSTPIFFGAISTYAKELLPRIKFPEWFTKLLNAKPMLKIAAKKAGSTRAAGLEAMTISMLNGEKGNQADELEHLVNWIKTELQPDVIYLANVMLIGLAHKIKKSIRVPIVCALEDEDIWLEDMDEQSQEKIWQIISERSIDVDAFVPVSDYYRERMIEKIQAPIEKFHTVHIGIDMDGYRKKKEFNGAPVIGYLSRLTESLGFGIITDAFILLKTKYGHEDLKLLLTGGITDDDTTFLEQTKTKLKQANCLENVTIIENYDRQSRIDYLSRLTLLSVPMIKGEAFGLFQLEALAAGVPIVQPQVGAFPEIIEKTGGGITYYPNSPEKLAEAIDGLLADPKRLKSMSETGRTNVETNFSNIKMASRLIEIYNKVIADN